MTNGLCWSHKGCAIDDPKKDDVYSYGDSLNDIQMLKLPDGTLNLVRSKSMKFKVKDDGDYI